jgi:uncharacterized paraquat-inducible protein A
MSLALTHDGCILATGGYDCTLRLWGLRVSDAEWKQMEQAWLAQKLREEVQAREEHELQAREQQQQQQWRAEGRCEVCGAPLGRWEKLRKLTRCKLHR